MSCVSDDAIVLRLADFSETSQIVTLFGREHGQTRLIAKGLRRPSKSRFAVGLDLMERGDVQFAPARADRDLGTLTAWRQRETYVAIRRTPASLYAGLYAIEAVGALTVEHDPNPAVYAALETMLSDLASGEAAGPRAVRFQRELLTAIGYLPELGRCMECGRVPPRGGPAYLSAGAGGLICRDCEALHHEKRRIPTTVVGIKSSQQVATEWCELLDYYLAQLAGRRFATSDMFLNRLRKFSDRIN